MRIPFAKALAQLASEDERIVLLSGDLGYTVLEPFTDAFPNRYFNMGVAEHNMIDAAAGMAEAGFVPFVYSIATFLTLRGYEAIRNGPVFHELPVRLVGVGAGLEYGHGGISHLSIDDLGVLRTQPGLTTVVPADHVQACNALRATRDYPKPMYFRLGNDPTTTVPSLEGRFTLGRAEVIGDGGDVAILATGAIATEAVAAAALLRAKSIRASVVIVSSFNPAPLVDIKNALERVRFAVTLEAHYVVGGLGSTVAELIADEGLGVKLRRLGVTEPPRKCGTETYMRRTFGLSAAQVAETTERLIRGV